MHAPKESLVAHTYDLLKQAIPVLNGFPRNYKFTLGDRLQNHLTDLLEGYIEATYLPAPEKRLVLKAINLRLEKIRYLFRLGYELGLYNSTKYQAFTVQVDTLGRMTGGWLKSLA